MSRIKIFKIMKLSVKLFGLLFLSLFVFAACSDDDDTSTPPEITNFSAGLHYGAGNTIVKEPGAEIIVDFDARSRNDGRLVAYHIEIHDHPESGDPDDEYKIIDEMFENDPKFFNTRNASIHKHIAIPEDAPLGEYHVEVIVFDEYGNTTDVDTIIFLVAPTEE
ncbi:hypothetical protein CDL62_00720 [Alkalitalea saponilacus]|uniref:DUF4625 domain-containing protein n=2 Tax=Alkalitalea saponilacus TaxID=889453 RepID=A0A1T5HKE7_9BACT|nr:hypothetical protein CDL62_00720 [Alkalitalea saponilacus]SKC21165.1 protein of unknown function [Alkalitalea saponilacus]